MEEGGEGGGGEGEGGSGGENVLNISQNNGILNFLFVFHSATVYLYVTVVSFVIYICQGVHKEECYAVDGTNFLSLGEEEFKREVLCP